MTIKNGTHSSASGSGLHTITPHLVVKNAPAAIEFYRNAFGAEVNRRLDAPNGQVLHADLRIGDSTLWLADECLEYGLRSPQTVGGTATGLCLHVADCDKAYERALRAGALSIEKPADTIWGSRFARLLDPYGHAWSIATQLHDVTVDEMKAAMAKMPPPPKSERPATVEALVLAYWKSWQKKEWAEMRSYLADTLQLCGAPVPADVFTDACKKGNAWRDVHMVEAQYNQDGAALLYEGVDTVSGAKMKVSELLRVAHGKIVALRSVVIADGKEVTF